MVRRRLATRHVVAIEDEPSLQFCPRAWIVPFQDQRRFFEMNRLGKSPHSAWAAAGASRQWTSLRIRKAGVAGRHLGKHFGKISVPVWRKRAPLPTGSMVTALAVRMCESTTFRSRSMGRAFPHSLGRSAPCTVADNLSALCRRRVTCHISASVSLPPKEGIALKRMPFFTTQ